MLRRIGTDIRKQWMGALALFLVLAGGTAYASHLVVRGSDVVDGSLTSADYKNDDIRSADVLDGTLGTADVSNNSLTGADVKESGLSTVPEALIARHGGWGRQSGGDERGEDCNPETSSFVICAIVNVTTTAPGRALVIGRIQAEVESGSEGIGDCRLGSSTVNPIPGTTVNLLVDSTVFGEWITVVGITPPLDPGTHAFGIDCNELLGGMFYSGARVTAVMLSPD